MPRPRPSCLISSLLLFIACVIGGGQPADAAITVVNYWRMGENDAAAGNGLPSTNTLDIVGGQTLANVAVGGIYPAYTSNVSATAAATTGSSLGLSYAGTCYGRANVLASLTNNFGFELWVNPVTNAAGAVLAYNGNTGSSGCGLFQSGGSVRLLFGGLNFFGSAPLPTNTWTHLALVCASGVTTVYSNGVSTGITTSQSFAAPAGNFLVGADNNGLETFTGSVDEARVFTFASGKFSTNDLLVNQSPAVTLSSTNLVESPAAPTDFLRLTTSPASLVWTASTTNSWIHLTNSEGANSNWYYVTFGLDTNTGSPRAGQLTIAGQTVTVTQAGSGYEAASFVPVSFSDAGGYALSIAATGAGGPGNVFAWDLLADSIDEWKGTMFTSITGGYADGLAADGQGHLYSADGTNDVVKKYTLSPPSSTTLISSNLTKPMAVAVDGGGNVYIADTGANAIKEWSAANQVVTTLLANVSGASAVAVDGVGNVYYTTGTKQLYEWNAATDATNLLVSTGTNGLAVDAAGNVFSDTTAGTGLFKWNVSTQTGSVVASVPIGSPGLHGVAVDSFDNLYAPCPDAEEIYEFPRAYLSTNTITEPGTAGSDVLPVVVAAPGNLAGGIFAPASDSSWLVITGVNSNVVGFSFANNPSLAARTGNISLLGRSVAVTQSGSFVALAGASLVEGPSAGSDCMVLAAAAPGTSWTASSSASWLTLPAASQRGSGSTNLLFTFAANPGATRAAVISVSNQSFTVTQAGSTYVPAGVWTTLPPAVSPGSVGADNGIAVDGSGNVYVPDSTAQAIRQWQPGKSQTTLDTNYVNSSPVSPFTLACDASANLFVADLGSGWFVEWPASGGALSVLAKPSAGSSSFQQIAVDIADNFYTANPTSNSIYKFTAASSAFAPLVTDLNYPDGVAVDFAGNLYIAESGANQITRRAATGAIAPLVTNLNQPGAVAVDVSGNVYFADTGSSSVKKWIAASGAVVTVASNLVSPNGLAVDADENLYVAVATTSPAIELPRAFVDPTPRLEGALAVTDSLPVVLPSAGSLLYPLNPIYTMPLTNVSVNSGVVTFACPSNTSGLTLTNTITILGQVIPIIQSSASVLTPYLVSAQWVTGNNLQLQFSNYHGIGFTVLTSSNVSLPLTNWAVAGAASNIGGELFQFTTPVSSNVPQSYFRIRSP